MLTKQANRFRCLFEKLDPDTREQVEAVVGDSPDEMRQESLPSTILDCSDGTIRVVREGAYPLEEVLKKAKK